jgi:diaminohydroxyphosphoribosylaminopyrimidine deaminase/5-amino-6-(5-phosphoribosylamino)uracil reductase
MTASPIVPIEKYMERCFELAALGGKDTKSNPNVGSVIVFDGQIIGEGYHRYYGGPHAEVEAFQSVSKSNLHKIKDATWYVSLEPCSHFGKTPPCAHKIVAEGCRKVVIGCLDPNPIVRGNGVKYLKDHGVEVISPFCESKANQLISKFKANLEKKPYIILKWAQSKDNYISKLGEQTWLTSQATGMLTHKWRTEVDGILIGKSTALIDNPSLTSRHYLGQNPLRIILDTHLSLPVDLNIYRDDFPTWTVTQSTVQNDDKKEQLVVSDVWHLNEILDLIYKKGIFSIIVEGGAQVLKSFIDQNLWHEARIIKTKVLLKEGISAPNVDGKLLDRIQIGDDDVYYIENPNQKV